MMNSGYFKYPERAKETARFYHLRCWRIDYDDGTILYRVSDIKPNPYNGEATEIGLEK